MRPGEPPLSVREGGSPLPSEVPDPTQGPARQAALPGRTVPASAFPTSSQSSGHGRRGKESRLVCLELRGLKEPREEGSGHIPGRSHSRLHHFRAKSRLTSNEAVMQSTG